jgi:hypothetical protein
MLAMYLIGDIQTSLSLRQLVTAVSTPALGFNEGKNFERRSISQQSKVTIINIKTASSGCHFKHCLTDAIRLTACNMEKLYIRAFEFNRVCVYRVEYRLEQLYNITADEFVCDVIAKKNYV